MGERTKDDESRDVGRSRSKPFASAEDLEPIQVWGNHIAIVAKMCNQEFERLPVLRSSKSCAYPSFHRKGKVTAEGQCLKRRGRNRILQSSLENMLFYGLDKRTVVHSGLQLRPHTSTYQRFQQRLLNRHQSWPLVTEDPLL